MESDGDIKPIIPADDTLDRSLLATPGVQVGKVKQSRYEDVWPEDVHAAFMEAIALYPPMGKRRLKYYRVSTYENEHSDSNRAKSFGRCQLIQSYILEKTGKNRSRKQVSSHLQRLKKIYKDDLAMRPFFSECSQPPSEHCLAPQAFISRSSQDTFANVSFGARHFKSEYEPTVDLWNTDAGTDINSLTLKFPTSNVSTASDGGSCETLDLSTNFREPSVSTPAQGFLSPPRCPTGTLRTLDGDYLSEFQDPLLCKDVMNGGSRVGSALTGNTSSLSMRRLASRFPIQSRADSGTSTHFSHTVHAPASQPTHQWISHDVLTDGICQCCNSPLVPAAQLLHPPFHHLQSSFASELEIQRLDPGLPSDWVWSQTPEISLGSRSIFSEYLLTTSRKNPTYPSPEMNSPTFRSNSASDGELRRLPQGIFYSYDITGPATTSVSDSGIDFHGQSPQELSGNLASLPIIKPTPVYPVSYAHSHDTHTSPLSYPSL